MLVGSSGGYGGGGSGGYGGGGGSGGYGGGGGGGGYGGGTHRESPVMMSYGAMMPSGGYGAMMQSTGYGGGMMSAGKGGGYGASSQELAYELSPIETGEAEQYAGSNNQPATVTSDGMEIKPPELNQFVAYQNPSYSALSQPSNMPAQSGMNQLEAHFQLPDRRK